MSDYHVYECDNCGHEVQWADHLPRGWQRRGNDDWCDGCIEDAQAELDAAFDDIRRETERVLADS
jgi:hypothetical protein